MSLPDSLKRQMLEEKTEAELRDVLAELFRSKGFRYVEKTHGAVERGIDIRFADHTSGLGDIWCGVVAKAGGIGGGHTRRTDLDVIVTQLVKGSKTRFPNPLDLKQPVGLDRLFVITNGRFTMGAQDAILEGAGRQTLGANVEFWGIERLVREIDEHKPELYSVAYPALLRWIENTQRLFARSAPLAVLSAEQNIAIPDILVDPVLLRLNETFQKDLTFEEFTKSLQRAQKLEMQTIYEKLKRDGTRMVILGESGSGKTMLVRSVLHHLESRYTRLLRGARSLEDVQLASQNAIVPLALRALQLVDECDIDGAITANLRQVSDEQSESVLELIRGGKVRALLVIDALDEIADGTLRSTAARAISRWAVAHPNISVIVTSRIAEYCRTASCLDQSFEIFNIMPLDWKQIRAVLEGLAAVLHYDKEEMLKVIERELSGLIGRIPSTPMVYSLIALVLSSAQFKEIPASLTILYQRFMELQLGQWDALKGVPALFDSKLKEVFLGELAYKLHCGGRSELPAADLIAEAKRFLEERGLELGEHYERIHQFVKDLSGRSCILDERDSVYSFRHMSYQQFFAAKHYDLVRESPEELAKRVLDDWWNNVIFFYCGLKGVIDSKMLETIKGQAVPHPFHLISRAISYGHFAQAAFQSPLVVLRQAVKFGFDDIVQFSNMMSSGEQKGFLKALAISNKPWLLRFAVILAHQGFRSMVLFPAMKAEYAALRSDRSPDGVLRQFLTSMSLSQLGLHEPLLEVLSTASDINMKAFAGQRLDAVTRAGERNSNLDRRSLVLFRRLKRKLRRDMAHRVYDPQRLGKRRDPKTRAIRGRGR